MSREFQKVPLQRLVNVQSKIKSEFLVQESIITFHCIGIEGALEPHTSLLGTPTLVNELHIGHLLSEGLIDKIPTIENFEFEMLKGKIHSYYNSEILKIPKPRLITTSCGACNHPDLSVDQLHGKRIHHVQQLTHNDVKEALEKMRAGMNLFESTGGCHGAALLGPRGDIQFVSEDIGRHNAVDKTIGLAVLSGIHSFDTFTLLLSGRCGWDIVAKATRIGIPIIASVGAFSTAALELARENEITLYGFVRESGAWKAGIN